MEPPKFFLNKWIMLEKYSDQKVTFLNTSTGRVSAKSIPDDVCRFKKYVFYILCLYVSNLEKSPCFQSTYFAVIIFT